MYDVIVIGGGTAGCFAAICAAKYGAKTLLVEKNSMPGGTMTAAGVNYPGLFFAWGKQIAGGPCLEALLRAGAPMPPSEYPMHKHWFGQIRVDEFSYVCVLEEMFVESGVELLYHTMVADVAELADRVRVSLTGKEGAHTVEGKILIDATGDANAVRLAGYPVEKRDVRQPATLVNTISGYDVEKIDREKFLTYIDECLKRGVLLPEDSQGGNFYGHLVGGRISMHVPCDEGESSGGRTRLEIRARKTLNRIVRALRGFAGLEDLRVSGFAIECGVRESVRIVGEARMTVENYLAGKEYADAICFCFYPVDEHLPTSIRKIYPEEGIVPSVPYRALIPKNARRILIAGRTVASDSDTNSAVRVQVPCMAMGQAAGVAAGIAAALSIPVSDVPIDSLRAGLRSMGAIVPEQRDP